MYRVAVRSLCDFAARSGDLDLRFTPVPSARQGMDGHAAVYRNRSDTYRSELSLCYEWKELEVRGRADGYDSKTHCLEEIKTYRGQVPSVPANQKALHWAQLKLYGAMLCHEQDCDWVDLAMVYFHIDSHKETREQQRFERPELSAFFQDLAGRFLLWAQQEAKHRCLIVQASRELQFPYVRFRPGQRDFSVQTFRHIRDAQPLLAQAPTGIGKTLAVLFPALKAVHSADLHKVFYLTAKNSGRQTALDSMRRLNGGSTRRWRVLELRAREKACVYPDKACHGESCPLARGFYDRLPLARQAAVNQVELDEYHLRQIADAHSVCPYYLQQEMIRWADVLVGDYNHYFDAAAILHSQSVALEWRVAVLIDEAHNLLDRARSMYSANLSEKALLSARKHAPATVKRSLTQLHRAMRDSMAEQATGTSYSRSMATELQQICQNVAARVGAYVADHPLENSHPLLVFYFDLVFFTYLTEQFNTHSLLEYSQQADHQNFNIAIRNVIPAAFLQDRYADAHGCILFSATLSPPGFYRDLLGMPANCRWTHIPSPFKPEQLRVHLCPLSTRYADRQSSLDEICHLVGEQYARHAGNYLLFTSSFEYLRQIAIGLTGRYPHMPLWIQEPRMSSEQRQQFLDNFTEQGQGLGLAVLGGTFSEGVDLPGKRLIGAFIATLGLPQYNDWNEAVMKSMSTVFGPGLAYEYAYLYPGLRKVVQAAGRVIRSESDEGVLYLLDDRYAQSRIKKLLPTWWKVAV